LVPFEYAVVATFTLPPKDTADPLIVIDEFVSFAFVIEPASIASVMDPAAGVVVTVPHEVEVPFVVKYLPVFPLCVGNVSPAGPVKPVNPIGPCGIPKLKVAAEAVPVFVTDADDPADNVVVEATDIVAAAPAVPVSHVGPVGPATVLAAPIAPVTPCIPCGPCGPTI